mgnify:CR=1 FL=1
MTSKPVRTNRAVPPETRTPFVCVTRMVSPQRVRLTDASRADVLAAVEVPDVGDRIVAVQQGPVLATSFHPEVSDDLRLHRYFLDVVTGYGR